ncbi:tRNA pseudouridine(55) synthase TruB [Thermodesulfobacteriota bacterium]
MGHLRDGIILIDKNEGETSHDVVDQIRRILKIRKVGHAGTLDPFATGLLVVLLGEGTKLSPYLLSGVKRYLATMRLGIETDTQDLCGRIIHTRPLQGVTPADILEQASGFIGEIEQTPPAFSAVRWKGKRAYQFARKGIQPPLKSRKVWIHSLEVTRIELPDVTIEVSCSSGTYIRSLAASLGKRLGPGGHLIALRRLSSEPFSVEDALNLRMPLSEMAFVQDRIFPLSRALPQMPAVPIENHMAQKIRNGYRPDWMELSAGSGCPDFCEGYMKLLTGGDLVAIIELKASTKEHLLKIKRVFH